jgi:Holliday junction resolvasome RuvABC endonuclease subunit
VSEKPVVLGIDPSLTACGVALLQDGRIYPMHPPSIIRTKPSDGSDARRIGMILDALPGPEIPVAVVAIETQHGAWGSTEGEIRAKAASAQRVAAVRGAVTGWAAQRGAEVVEVSPQEAKRRLTGNGKATKRQMVAAVRARFGVLVGQDAADAVGMALVAEGQAVMAALRGGEA